MGKWPLAESEGGEGLQHGFGVRRGGITKRGRNRNHAISARYRQFRIFQEAWTLSKRTGSVAARSISSRHSGWTYVRPVPAAVSPNPPLEFGHTHFFQTTPTLCGPLCKSRPLEHRLEEVDNLFWDGSPAARRSAGEMLEKWSGDDLSWTFEPRKGPTWSTQGSKKWSEKLQRIVREELRLLVEDCLTLGRPSSDLFSFVPNLVIPEVLDFLGRGGAGES